MDELVLTGRSGTMRPGLAKNLAPVSLASVHVPMRRTSTSSAGVFCVDRKSHSSSLTSTIEPGAITG